MYKLIILLIANTLLHLVIPCLVGYFTYIVGIEKGAIEVTKGERVCKEMNSYKQDPVFRCRSTKETTSWTSGIVTN